MLKCNKVVGDFGKKQEFTGFNGSPVWKEFHNLLGDKNKMYCDYCRDKAIKLGRGLHDSINAHLGKKIQYPEDLKFLQKHVTWSIQNV